MTNDDIDDKVSLFMSNCYAFAIAVTKKKNFDIIGRPQSL